MPPAGSEQVELAETATWTGSLIGISAVGLVAGVLVRLLLLPTEGFRGDLDQFVGWVHHIATQGLGSLYGETAAGPVTFGPVMAYVWAVLAAVEPAFRVVTDASDPAIRVLMKLPAMAADIGLGLVVAYALRDRPNWAATGTLVVFLHPAVIDVSAWWGQYESIYVLPALIAVVLAMNGRFGWAAVAIAIAIMTKPQALPLALPLAAWLWAVGGPREVLRAGALVVGTTVVLWLPFLAAGGPAGYVANLATYQGEIFSVLSVRAWNVWWLVQEAFAGGAFIGDAGSIAGPITWRHLGYAIAGLLELVVALAVVRDARPAMLVLASAASVLVVFTFATQMHERYAYAALVFLALLVRDRRGRWLSLAFGVVFTLNLLAAIPPTPGIGALLPVAGALGVLGSLGMIGITYSVVRWLAIGRSDRDAIPELRGP